MILDKLVSSGIQLKTVSVGNHKTYCPECKNTRKIKNKHDTPLSVSIDNDGGAVWNCHNCGWNGNIASNGYHLDNVPPRKIRKPIIKNVNDLSEDTLKWFEDRKITKPTLEQFKIYKTSRQFGDDKVGCIAFPYIENGSVVNIKYRTRDKVFRQESGAQRTLYNIVSVTGD